MNKGNQMEPSQGRKAGEISSAQKAPEPAIERARPVAGIMFRILRKLGLLLIIFLGITLILAAVSSLWLIVTSL